MKIYLNKLHFPVTVLGHGRRIGLWVQGCTIGCAGCMSRDTWDRHEDSAVDLDEVVAWCLAQAEAGADGITISGGEPFEQAEALHEFLVRIGDWRSRFGRDFDTLCFSGMRLSRLRRDFAPILARIDVLIPEPFHRRRAGGGRWRGSDNQPLITLSDLGRSRYGGDLIAPEVPEIQAGLSDGRFMYIGIPRRGDMESLEAGLRARGLTLKGVSWHG